MSGNDTNSRIGTSGGAYIGNDINAGRDVAGRDIVKNIYHSSDPTETMIQQATYHSRVAEKFIRVEKWQEAVEAYSKAINAYPSSDLFVARGKAYFAQWENNWSDNRESKLRELAYGDFCAALKLAEGVEEEKQARLGRLRAGIRVDEIEEDLEWLKKHTTGHEYGLVLCKEVESSDLHIFRATANEAVILLTNAINSGYRESHAYLLRAEANAAVGNYGLALSDINEGITKIDNYDRRLIPYLCLRANILLALREYKQAYSDLSKGQLLHSKLFEHCISLEREYELLEHFIYGHLMIREFQGDDLHSSSAIVRFAALELTVVPEVQIFHRDRFHDLIKAIVAQYPDVGDELHNLIHSEV